MTDFSTPDLSMNIVQPVIKQEHLDTMLFEWRNMYYSHDMHSDEAAAAERTRRIELGQFVMQQDAPGGSKQFRAFPSVKVAFDYIVSRPKEYRTFYETLFKEQPRQKPYFDLDIIPTVDDPFDHTELLNRLLTEVKRVIGPELDLTNDISVYSSHAEDGSKRSYHIVISGFFTRSIIESRDFARVVRDGMVAATEGPLSPAANFITKCVDLVVYKKMQQFRILGCTKLGKNRFKQIVLEYSASGRTRRRAPVQDAYTEFRRSLLSVVDDPPLVESEPKYLEPKLYNNLTSNGDLVPKSLDQSDAILKSLYNHGRTIASGDAIGIDAESLWMMDSKRIVAHLIDSGHLPPDLASSCSSHTVSSSTRGALISFRAPRSGGYFCILCERRHESENPYVTLHEDSQSEAATALFPRVVSLIYRCRRDPLSSIRVCSMRGGGPSGMTGFTCTEEPYDPRQGEVYVKEGVASAAVDA